MAWKRLTPVRSLNTKDGIVYPSFLDSWLAWRKQLTTVRFWDVISPLIPGKEHWSWERNDIAQAFAQKLGKDHNGSCPQCNDVGRIKARTPDGETYEMWCLCQVVEWVKTRKEMHRAYSSAFLPATMKGYDINGGYAEQNGSLLLARDAALGFCTDPSRWLILSGSKGLGKTHLLRTIATVYGPGVALYLRAQDFVNMLMDRTIGDGEDMANFLYTLKTAPILLIDDVGAEYRKSNPGPSAKTPYALSKLTDVVDARYGNPEEYMLAITTNESQQSFQSDSWGILGDRLTDLSNTIIGMTGPSYRQSKKRAEA